VFVEGLVACDRRCWHGWFIVTITYYNDLGKGSLYKEQTTPNLLSHHTIHQWTKMAVGAWKGLTPGSRQYNIHRVYYSNFNWRFNAIKNHVTESENETP